MIALRRLVFGSRDADSGLRIHVITPPADAVSEPEPKPEPDRRTSGSTVLDRMYSSRYDTEAMWYRLGGR